MRLGTLRTQEGTAAVLVTGSGAVEIEGAADVGTLLADRQWRPRALAAAGHEHPLSEIAHDRWAPVVPRPGKVLCVGLNYRAHILEMGREVPEFPTVFAKYPEALVGAGDPVELAPESDEVDWEGELAVVMGGTVRRASEAEAAGAIAGYAVLNDVTMRDFQYRTVQWLQGKTFEATTPFGPHLVTADEWRPGPVLRTVVDDETVQEAPTSDLVFGPAALVSYLSTIVTLSPGDVIATGTPGGVGHSRKPPRYLHDGTRLVTSIEGLGELRNTAVRRG